MVIPLTLNFQAWTKLAVSDALKEAESERQRVRSF